MNNQYNTYETNASITRSIIKPQYVVAVYIRVSSPEQAKKGKFSLEIQERDSIAYAKKHGWKVFDVYEDIISGYLDYSIRKSGSRLLNDAKEGKFNTVLFWDNDRNGRDPEAITAKMFRHQMRMYGVQVTSVSNPTILKDPDEFKFEPFDEGQIFMETIQDLQSSMTVSKFRKRSMDGRTERVKNGKMICTPPYGYKLQVKTDNNGNTIYTKDRRAVFQRVINELERPYVIRIYDEYVNKHRSMNEIRDGLNKDKVPTKKGVRWERAMVKRVLINPIYYGALFYNKNYRRKNALDGTSRWGANPAEKWVVVSKENTEHGAIIDEEMFKKAQVERNSKRKMGAVAIYNKYLFSGLLRCGKCGLTMYSMKYKNKYKRKTDGITTESLSNAYICSGWTRFKDTDKNFITEKIITSSILKDLSKYKNNPNLLKSFLNAQNSNLTREISDRLNAVNKNLFQVTMRKKRLFRLYEYRKISDEDYDEELDCIHSEIVGMQGEQKRLEDELATETKKDISRNNFVDLLNDFEKIFELGDIKLKKGFLRSLIDNIVVKDRRIRINYLI